MNLLRRQPTPESDEARRRKAEERSARMELVKEARTATKEMKPPEPSRGLYVSAFLVAVGLVSYLSTDVANEQVKNSAGKYVNHSVLVQHPAQSVILIVLAAVAAATIYWRRRLVTGIAFMLAAAIGVGTPLPKGLSDLTWLTFLVPAAYVLWMLIFRMNKEQKAWMDARRPAGTTASGGGGSKSGGRKGSATRVNGSRSGDKRDVTASGRQVPPASRRYTPPRQKSKAAGRRP
jgi:uncharacterized membrane protein YgcG